MKVKDLICELLNMPMDATVNIVYVDEECEYKYQDVCCAVNYYDEDNVIGILGTNY